MSTLEETEGPRHLPLQCWRKWLAAEEEPTPAPRPPGDKTASRIRAPKRPTPRTCERVTSGAKGPCSAIERKVSCWDTILVSLRSPRGPPRGRGLGSENREQAAGTSGQRLRP